MGQELLTHAWVNAVLGLITGLLMVSFNRWPHMRWLVTHVFYAAVSGILVLGVPSLFSADQRALLQAIGYLTLLAAVIELQRIAFQKTPLWAWPALPLILAYILFPSADGAFYFLPRLVLFGGTALSLGKAIAGRNLPLFALASLSLGGLVSDALRALAMISPHSILSVQFALELWWSSAAWCIFLAGILWPELSVLVRETALMRRDGFEYSLPVNAGESIRGIARLGQAGDDLDHFMRNAAVASGLSGQDYFTLAELALFLSSPESVARAFVENNGVRKVFPVGDPDNWLVARRDVREALTQTGFLGD